MARYPLPEKKIYLLNIEEAEKDNYRGFCSDLGFNELDCLIDIVLDCFN